VWGASGVALTAVASALLFGELLTGTMILGLVLIILGVLCIELGSQLAAQKKLKRA
jgi:small multidrug resistance pump